MLTIKTNKGDRLNKSILFWTILTIFCCIIAGCEELPPQSKGPDNRLDPYNPDNDIQGPAIVLSPTKIDVKMSGQFQLDLWTVETDSMTGISTRILFDPAKLSVIGVDSLNANSESLFLQNGGQLIWFYTTNNDSGYIQIDCAVVEGTPRYVAGTGIISKIDFQHLSGTSAEIDISEKSLLRNDINKTQNINDRIGSQINIK
jgi:hypothetical protein